MQERKGARQLAAVVLAAGESKRFKSRTPKVLHDVCGLPLVAHVLNALEPLHAVKTVLVVGRGAEHVQQTVKRISKRITFAVQEQRLGTADAARIGDETLGARFRGDVLVVPGDTPLLDTQTLHALIEHHRATHAAVTILTAHFDNPAGYGRIVRDADGAVSRIVEDADATPAERAISEGNAGVYVLDRGALRTALTKVESANKQGELYLTDVVEILKDKGERIEAFVAPDQTETLGINDRAQLAIATRIIRDRILSNLMRGGVTIEDPGTTYVDATVTIKADTIIRPLTFLRGSTSIGEACRIGPNVEIVDSMLGNEVTISQAIAREVTLKDGAAIGPFASLRPGTVLQQKAKAGTFVELKASEVGKGSKVPHLSYVGDATIGRDVNVGAGTITCNYDGETKVKSKTVIGDEALIGSDTMLVAPVKLGKRAVTGAGSVVTKDVNANQVVVGAPAKPVRSRKPPKMRKTKGRT